MVGPVLNCGLLIDGKEVLLVPVEEGHLEHCARMFSDPEVTRYLGSRYRGFVIADERDWYQKTRTSDDILWSILVEGEHVGEAGIHKINPISRTGITGMVIDRPYWRKGIASAVQARRAAYARDCRNLRRLYTEICEANTGSLKAAMKAGYVEYGRRPDAHYIDGRYYDTWLGSLLLQP